MCSNLCQKKKRNMDCKQYLRSLCLVVVVHDAMGIELSTGNCLYVLNDIPIEKTLNKTSQICCPKSGVQDKYKLGKKVECCGDTTYTPGIELCCNEKVYKVPDTDRTSNGNKSQDTSSKENIVSMSPLKKQGNQTFHDDLPQNKMKKKFLDATFKRLMKQKGRNLLRELLMYIDVSKANIYPKSLQRKP